MNENADCVGKIGDFGLSQHVSPFCNNILGNIEETAPETWGDSFILRSTVFYDEKSDVFSFSMILWRLFVGLNSTDPEGSPYSLRGPHLRQEIRNVCVILVSHTMYRTNYYKEKVRLAPHFKLISNQIRTTSGARVPL